ncbi:MAG: hypothetical protein LUG91_09110 [Ruminococcus sp.]|nr:hypothetical protein [Ruminococcus sp.]
MAMKGTKRTKGTNGMTKNLAYAAKYGPDFLTGYAIGTALGNLWNDNYNRRGIEKSNATTAAGTDEIFNSEYQQYLPQREPMSDQLFNQGVQGGALSLNGDNFKNMMQLGEETKALERSGDLQPLSFQKERNLEEEKLDYLVEKYGGQTPNPDGDAMVIGNLSNRIKGDLQNVDVSKIPRVLTENDYIAPIRKQLQKEGRTEYQIEQAVENAMPDIQSKVKQGQDIVFGRLGNLLNTQLKSGDLDNARMTYARMTEINPTMAQAMGTGLNRATANEEAQYQLNNRVELLKKNFGMNDQQARNYALGGSIYSPQEQEAMRNFNSGIYSGGTGTDRRSSSRSMNVSGNSNSDVINLAKDPTWLNLQARNNMLTDRLNALDEDDPQRAQLLNNIQQNYIAMDLYSSQRLGMPTTNTGTLGTTEQSGQVSAPTERPLSDAAEERRQRLLNRGAIFNQASRANFSVTPTGKIYATPYASRYPELVPEEQAKAFEEFRKRYKSDYPEMFDD